MGLAQERWQLAFQSRFGRAQWLQPYTSETLRTWAGSGVKQVDVVCPGFSADCLETLEEIAMQNRDFFLSGGGESLHYIPALNDRDDHILALTDVAASHLQGWPEAASSKNATSVADALEASRRRALAMGAAR